MSRTCDVHDVPIRDDEPMCRKCRSGLEHDLGDMGALAKELDITLSRQRAVTYGGTRPAETPLPFDSTASEVAYDLRATLVGWVRDIAGEGTYPADTVEAMSGWLLARIDTIARHPAVEEVVGELGDVARRARRAVDRRPDRWYLGRCWTPTDPTKPDGDRCETDLYVKPHAEVIACPGCGASWPVADRREWLLAAAEDHLATATEIGRAAALFGVDVTPAAIRNYKDRDRIMVRGVNLRGHPLFRVGDVLEVAMQAAAHRGRRSA